MLEQKHKNILKFCDLPYKNYKFVAETDGMGGC